MRLRVEDDLRRSRLTVFFRVLLVIPHFIWLYFWFWAFLAVLFFNWFATLFAGRTEEDVHSFLGRWLRYQTHVNAYMFLVANPWPRFSAGRGRIRSISSSTRRSVNRGLSRSFVSCS